MSAASRLIFPHANAILLIVFFALVSLGFQLFTTYARYAKYLKYLTFSLLSYIVVAFVVHVDWNDVLNHTLSPSLTWSKDQIFILCAILGTTISPYLFFWQTSQEVEEEILHGERSILARQQEATPKAIRKMRTDVWSGMAFSNIISFFIFVACAGTLYSHGITDIKTADEAALALRPFGEFAYWLFAFGIVGTGMLAVPVFAGSTAYALSESFGWKYGMYRTMQHARAFYGVIIISVALGIAGNFFHVDPMKALIYASVANGIIAPFLLYFVVRISGSEKIMGKHASHPLLTLLGWLTILGMAGVGIAAIITFFF
jgi:Mn2+/Fe2+ NRAMP family transporter